MWKPQALSDSPLSDHSWSTMRRTEEMWVSHHMFEISNSPSGDKMGKCESNGQIFEEIWGEALKNEKKNWAYTNQKSYIGQWVGRGGRRRAGAGGRLALG